MSSLVSVPPSSLGGQSLPKIGGRGSDSDADRTSIRPGTRTVATESVPAGVWAGRCLHGEHEHGEHRRSFWTGLSGGPDVPVDRMFRATNQSAISEGSTRTGDPYAVPAEGLRSPVDSTGRGTGAPNGIAIPVPPTLPRTHRRDRFRIGEALRIDPGCGFGDRNGTPPPRIERAQRPRRIALDSARRRGKAGRIGFGSSRRTSVRESRCWIRPSRFAESSVLRPAFVLHSSPKADSIGWPDGSMGRHRLP